MHTIRPHSREERRAFTEALVPRIQSWFGDRLLALATMASVARGEDGPYSDLELLAVVRDGPRGGGSVIHDGMLVELEWMTADAWLASCREVTDEWYLAGSSRLQPLTGPDVIERLNAAEVEDLVAKCRRRAGSHWYDVQESTAKVLGALASGNLDALGLVAWDMLRHMLISLSFLNARPYTTLASMIPEALRLPRRPETLDGLVRALAEGVAQDPTGLRARVEGVYAQLEDLHRDHGTPLGDGAWEALAPSTSQG